MLIFTTEELCGLFDLEDLFAPDIAFYTDITTALQRDEFISSNEIVVNVYQIGEGRFGIDTKEVNNDI